MATNSDAGRLSNFELTGAEARELFDREARRTLGLSGEEFLARYDAGEMGDPDSDLRVMNMVFLLPLVRDIPLRS